MSDHIKDKTLRRYEYTTGTVEGLRLKSLALEISFRSCLRVRAKPISRHAGDFKFCVYDSF